MLVTIKEALYDFNLKLITESKYFIYYLTNRKLPYSTKRKI